MQGFKALHPSIQFHLSVSTSQRILPSQGGGWNERRTHTVSGGTPSQVPHPRPSPAPLCLHSGHTALSCYFPTQLSPLLDYFRAFPHAVHAIFSALAVVLCLRGNILILLGSAQMLGVFEVFLTPSPLLFAPW